jgi:hypothetical protein
MGSNLQRWCRILGHCSSKNKLSFPHNPFALFNTSKFFRMPGKSRLGWEEMGQGEVLEFSSGFHHKGHFNIVT